MRFLPMMLALSIPICAAQLDRAGLEAELQALTRSFDGRVGACVQDAQGTACVRAGERFSMQSVIKMLVGVAVGDRVDHAGWKWEEPITIYKRDLSLAVQPVAKLVTDAGYKTTIGDLVRRAIIDSDSAAVDILIRRLGGPAKVQEFLTAKGITGIRLDREERQLQTETIGITWRQEFVDPVVLAKAIADIPEERRSAAYTAYKTDPRDTSTPRAMAAMLFDLQRGALLSKSSTAFVMQAMKECATFPDRLKAGLAPGWQIAHKTGSSGTWKGLTVATNDVGVIRSPAGEALSIVAFIADSRASQKDKAALMARISAAAIRHFH
ncbi:MAG: class A beta-lactamase [Acidobacteria bacterium]|nr:class A beta-lactamase [Acidobacteriota bacterium]